jgi:succinoglycan biosynthesis transport protein ExoP
MDYQSYSPRHEDFEAAPRRAASVHPPIEHTLLANSNEIVHENGVSLLGEYWYIVRRHIWILITITILGVLAGVSFSWSQVRIYRAHALMEIQGLNDNFLNIKDISPVAELPYGNVVDDIQSQIKILQSRTLLQRVLTRLHIRGPEDLGHNTGRTTTWGKAPDFGTPGSPSSRELANRIATRNLSIRGVGRTRMIEISYEATDPKAAAVFVNTLTDEFITYDIEVRQQMSRRTNEWINGQLEDIRRKLAASEDALKDYARRSGLVILSETTNVSEDKLRRLQEETTRAQADRFVKESRYEIAKNSVPEALPDVLNDALLKDYQSQLTALQRQKAELSTAFTPEYSKLSRINAQIKSLESALQSHRSALLQQIRNQYEEAVGREKLLAANYAKETGNLVQEGAKTVTYALLKRDLDSNRLLYDAMLQRTKTAGVASGMHASNARIIDEALPSLDPVKPHTSLNIAISFLGSLMAGLLVITMRERGDHTIRRPGELRNYLSIGELGVIPSASKYRAMLPSGVERPRTTEVIPLTPESKNKAILSMPAIKKRNRLALITSAQEHSALAQSFWTVVASIRFSHKATRQPRLLVVASPNPGEGKTTVASNLAITLAGLQDRVLLIDGDPHRPRLHEVFGLSDTDGFTDLLKGTSDGSPPKLMSVVQKTDIPGLFVLSAGTQRGNNSLLRTARLMDVLNEARVHFNTIVIDTPPILGLADARVLSRCADGVILVARTGVTTRESAIVSHRRLAEDGAHVLGTILNDWDSRSVTRGYYGY